MINKNEAIKNNIKVIDNSIKNELFENLKTNFPQTIIEGKADLKAISLLLGLDKKSDISGYELTWTGKGLSNENFIYPDNFRQDYKKILEEVGLIEIDENGQEVESEDLKFFKNIQGSRTHSGWLSFMLPRLKLARDLLKEDGVIFISIDDNEQANLKLLCDEIFGEDNFVANIIWHSKNKPSGNTTENKTIDTRTEHILCYQKSYFLANKYENTKDELKEKGYILKDEFFKTRGYYKLTPLMRSCSASSFKYIESLDYEVKAPDGTIFKNHQNIKKPKSYRYTWSKKLFDFGNANGFIEIQKTSDGFWCIYRKMYEFCAIDNKKLEIVYRKSGNAYNNLITGIYSDIGANEVRNLMGGEKIFTYAKPINLIKTLLQISTTPNSNDIILDFFAGSGTTAQAVMELNAEDKGNREFILVQIDEEIKEDKSKSAYDFCKKELKSKKPVISDITIERVKRAAQKIIQSSKDNDLNLGFKVFTLEDKPEIIIDKDKNLKLINRRNLSVIDKVVNMFLISGKTLDKKIENIFDGKLYKCEDSFYLIECDKEILKYLTKTQNEYILIDAYGDIELEDFLNLGAGFKERLKVVY